MTKEYEFTLKYKLPSQEYNLDELAEKLYANGCDDALIGIGVAGKIALEFVREAESAQVAIHSAHQNVLNVLPEAILVEAMPDYVGLTDIAKIVSVSRQHMRNLYEINISFPAPVHEGKSSIWHLADVLSWIQQNKSYSFEPTVFEVAQANAELNSVSRPKQHSAMLINSYSKATVVVKKYLISTSLSFSDTQSFLSAAEAA